MPLVGGDMCPIAIDVVEKFQIIAPEPELVEYDSPLHYIKDHKELGEDLPIIEKAEHHEAAMFDDDLHEYDHVIPEKHEHHIMEDEYESPDHYIPEKTEHDTGDVHSLPKEHWTPEFHGPEEDDEIFDHSSGRSIYHTDGIEDYLFDAPEEPGLKPKKFNKDDPRFNIPTEKSTPAHDHLIVSKDAVEMDTPQYGKAYERDRKESLRGGSESIGLAPMMPT